MDDVLRRATALTNISAVAGSVVGKVWSAKQARAGRVQHFLKQLLHNSWDYAADHSGRLTVDIRRAVAYATTTSQSVALDLPRGSLLGLRAHVECLVFLNIFISTHIQPLLREQVRRGYRARGLLLLLVC